MYVWKRSGKGSPRRTEGCIFHVNCPVHNLEINIVKEPRKDTIVCFSGVTNMFILLPHFPILAYQQTVKPKLKALSKRMLNCAYTGKCAVFLRPPHPQLSGQGLSRSLGTPMDLESESGHCGSKASKPRIVQFQTAPSSLIQTGFDGTQFLNGLSLPIHPNFKRVCDRLTRDPATSWEWEGHLFFCHRPVVLFERGGGQIRKKRSGPDAVNNNL